MITRLGKPADSVLCFQLDRKMSLNKSGTEDEGFLLCKDTESDYQKFFLNGFTLVVVDNDETLLGFLIGFDKSSPLFERFATCLTDAHWFSENPIEREDLFYIEKIVVCHDARRKGVGRSLYQQLFDSRPNSEILAVVSERPFYNQASEKFHLETGFRRVAVFNQDNFADHKEIRNGIYAKYL